MDKYLDLLNKIKSDSDIKKYLPQLEKIESYVKGEITSQELITDADNTTNRIIYYTINKLLNYEERDVRYFIQLPNDMFFNTGTTGILAGKIEEYGIIDNHLKAIGPEYYAERWSGFFDRHYIEITGDFSKYPKGVMLFRSDWVRIISKYPNLYERMYNLTINDYEFRDRTKDKTFEQVKEKVDKYISDYISDTEERPRNSEPDRYLGDKEAVFQYIPQEVIDSIKFIIPIEYLTIDQVLSGNFGTFEEVAKGIKNKVTETHDGESQMIDNSIQATNNLKQTAGESTDDIITVGLGDIVDYMEGPSRKYIAQAIDLDMRYMTEKSVRGSSKKELVVMLADFVLNYKGNNAQSHLLWLARDPKVVNGRVCDIPIMELAKLNSSEIANSLSKFGAEDVKTTQSENQDLVASVAEILGYGQERRSSISDTMSVINDILGTNAEKPFKNK